MASNNLIFPKIVQTESTQGGFVDCEDTLATQWYVLTCKPHKEHLLLKQLQELGFDTFFPRFELSLDGPRRRKVTAFFPGYLFVKADLEKVGESRLHWMLFISGLMCNGGNPAFAPDELLWAMQLKVKQFSQITEMAVNSIGVGSVGQMEASFLEYEAVLDPCLKGSERIKLLHKLLQH